MAVILSGSEESQSTIISVIHHNEGQTFVGESEKYFKIKILEGREKQSWKRDSSGL
jgi:hypothetical protein